MQTHFITILDNNSSDLVIITRLHLSELHQKQGCKYYEKQKVNDYIILSLFNILYMKCQMKLDSFFYFSSLPTQSLY